MSKLDSLFKECTEIIDQITPFFRNKPKEYEQVQNLVKSAIVRTCLTGKSISLTQGLQQLFDALIKSSHLEEETTKICGEIDQLALSLMRGDLGPASATQQLAGLKTRLQGTYHQTMFVAREIRFSHKLIRRQLRS